MQEILWQAFCAVLGVLIVVLAYMGNRIHCKLDEISTALIAISSAHQKDISKLSERVTKLETRYHIEHGHD